jgi:hypothetical protein
MAVTNSNSATLKFTINIGGKAFSIVDGGPYSGKYVHNVEAVITAGAVNTALAVTVPYASMQIVGLAGDQALTVKVNSTTTPTETFTLSATSGVIWTVDTPTTNPFAHDIVTLYVSNPGTTDARFHFAALTA